MTKLQLRVNASKRSKRKRVAVALAKYLKLKNPAQKLAGAKVEKLKGGVLKITPIKANAGLSPNLRKAGARAVKAYEKAKAQWERVGAEYGFGPSAQMTRASKAYEKARVRLRVLSAKAEGRR